MIIRKGYNTVVFTGLLMTIAGCAGVGPNSVARDRFDYTAAISDSWKAQMLVNMVKIRYGDTPTFLDVASVINQYSIESQLDLRLTWVDHLTAALANNQSAGAAARSIDRPTITYSPLMGEKFARSLMTPIPPEQQFEVGSDQVVGGYRVLAGIVGGSKGEIRICPVDESDGQEEGSRQRRCVASK